jgi:hypothetical protein
MSQILYDNRCKCNEEFSITKKRKSNSISEGKPLQYPKSNEIRLKTFQIEYSKTLSLTGKCILNSFQNKYIYYAIDDIIYSLKSNPTERDNLLAVLYSPILSLQNDFLINFFDIWICDVYLSENLKPNKFLNQNSDNLEKVNHIIIKLFYKTRVPIKKQDSLW